MSEVARVEEGCTTISITTTRRDARTRFSLPFRVGEFTQVGVLTVHQRRLTSEDTNSAPDSQASGYDQAGSVGNKVLEAQLSRALQRQALMRGRLAALTPVTSSPSRSQTRHCGIRLRKATIAHTKSPCRSLERGGGGKSLRIDLAMTLLLWPALTALLLALLLFRLPAGAVTLGMISGLALSIVGAQPCSLLISPLACGAGTIVMAFCFWYCTCDDLCPYQNKYALR